MDKKKRVATKNGSKIKRNKTNSVIKEYSEFLNMKFYYAPMIALVKRAYEEIAHPSPEVHIEQNKSVRVNPVQNSPKSFNNTSKEKKQV